MPKLIRLSPSLTDAILTVFKYVHVTTGVEPSQTEVSSAIKSYFMLNENGNQIKFQRKKPVSQPSADAASKDPFWKMNLKTGPAKNSLIRVGLFHENIKEALIAVQRFVTDAGAAKPSETEIALSLKSSFILSEIKNQIDWQRNERRKPKNVGSKAK